MELRPAKIWAKTVMYYLLWSIFIPPLTSIIIPLNQPKDGEQDVQPISWKCVRRVEAVTSWQFVQSRGYPRLLDVQISRCSWKIVTNKGNRIRLAFRGLDLYADDPNHCSSNYVEIIDESLRTSQARFCGSNIPNDIVSEGHTVRIDFQAQPGIATNSKGFSIGYTKTLDTAGFYSWQSFSPDKRAAPRKPSTYYAQIPRVINNDNSKQTRITNDASLNDKDETSIESIAGGLIGAIAIMLLGLLLWKNRNVVLAFLRRKMENEKETTSFGSYPLPPQVVTTRAEEPLQKSIGSGSGDIKHSSTSSGSSSGTSDTDPFERIMSVVEPFPAPCDDDRFMEVASDFTTDKGFPVEQLSVQDLNEDMSFVGSCSRDRSRPTSRLSHRSHIPTSSSRLSSYIGGERHPMREKSNLGRRKISTIHDALMEENPFQTSNSRSVMPVHPQSGNIPSRTVTRQNRTAQKLYLPEVPLLPPRDEDEPPPLPPKTRSRMPQEGRPPLDFNRFFHHHRTTSLPFNETDNLSPRRSRSYGNERLLHSQWCPRSKSVSNLSENHGSTTFAKNFSPKSRYEDDFDRDTDNMDSFFRLGQKDSGLGTLSRFSRPSKSKSFLDIPVATQRPNTKWTFLEPPNFEGNFSINSSSVHPRISNKRENRQLHRDVKPINGLSFTVCTANESLPPPLPIKKKKSLNRL